MSFQCKKTDKILNQLNNVIARLTISYYFLDPLRGDLKFRAVAKDGNVILISLELTQWLLVEIQILKNVTNDCIREAKSLLENRFSTELLPKESPALIFEKFLDLEQLLDLFYKDVEEIYARKLSAIGISQQELDSLNICLKQIEYILLGVRTFYDTKSES